MEEDKDDELDEQISKLEQSMKYEYYVHYYGVDRRNDRWVTEQLIKSDPDEIKRQLKAINIEEDAKKATKELEKEHQMFSNDENHGMTEKEV